MGPFHLESIAAGGDRAVLRIDGDIDACTAPQLRERVMRGQTKYARKGQRARRVVGADL
jgi:anti-anti-sigma regulatory factor